MNGPLTKVREIPNIGFEVVRLSALGRRPIGFRLHAADANQVARESYEMDRALLMLDPKGPQPRLELWEAQA
jgi:hypothetical protein